MSSIEQIYSALPVVASGATRHTHQSQYLSFTLSGELFALDIFRVREIIEFEKLGRVPHMPNFINGVLDLRGAAVPVVDLGVRFCKRMDEMTRGTCIIVEIVREGAQHLVGVMVDAVDEVLNIPDSAIEPTLSFGIQKRSDFISGMGKAGDQFVIILDVDCVLSLEEMSILAEMGAGTAVPA